MRSASKFQEARASDDLLERWPHIRQATAPLGGWSHRSERDRSMPRSSSMLPKARSVDALRWHARRARQAPRCRRRSFFCEVSGVAEALGDHEPAAVVDRQPHVRAAHRHGRSSAAHPICRARAMISSPIGVKRTWRCAALDQACLEHARTQLSRGQGRLCCERGGLRPSEWPCSWSASRTTSSERRDGLHRLKR
jgi:hypothetical protein